MSETIQVEKLVPDLNLGDDYNSFEVNNGELSLLCDGYYSIAELQKKIDVLRIAQSRLEMWQK